MTEKSKTFVSFDTAHCMILSSVTELGLERVPLKEAYGRILYQDIRSEINIPPFDNSAMDGFALHWDDTGGAHPDSPVELLICGELKAGVEFHTIKVEGNSAVRIMTGAPIPDGATAVVPVEHTREDATRGTIAVFEEIKQNENIRHAGEDIRVGQVALNKGTQLKSAEIGLLASLNVNDIPVYQQARVAIISTGDEIAEVGAELRPGQIRNSNAYTLSSEIKKYHCIPHYIGIARDSISFTKEMFAKALEYDMVISTGGVSMGKYDLVKDVLVELGVDISFETIRMKPGKPLIYGTRKNTLVFGLPGNPVSTMVSFIEFVRPALLKMSGSTKLNKPLVHAVADNDIDKRSGRKEFFRGYFTIIDGVFHVSTTGPQGSGILRSMSVANCLIVMNEESTGCSKGDRVMIQLINHEEID